jgi:ribosomal protein S5
VVGVLEGRQMLGQGRETELKEAIEGSIKKGFGWIKESLKF